MRKTLAHRVAMLTAVLLVGAAVAAAAAGCAGGKSANEPAAAQAQVPAESAQPADRTPAQPNVSAMTRAKQPPPSLLAAEPAAPNQPKAEFRGLFVATAYNLDWPSQPGLPVGVQKNEIRAIVQRAQELNCNAIILQVRAFGDRIYRESDLIVDNEPLPWSRSLKYTNDPGPGYDPLKVWIDECHEEGLLIYAWMNPFRTDYPVGNLPLIPNDEDPNHLYLDPTDPGVQSHALAVIKDLLVNYPPPKIETAGLLLPDGSSPVARRADCDGPLLDVAAPVESTIITPPTTEPTNDDGVDGVIIDHYLPEPPPDLPRPRGRQLQQQQQQQHQPSVKTDEKRLLRSARKPQRSPRIEWLLKKHKPNFAGTASVDDFIKQVHELLKAHDGKFGISTSMKQFEEPHANAKKWLQQGWCDYFMPELYDQDLTTFTESLETWNKLNNPQLPIVKPQIVPVLFTAAVATGDETGTIWEADDIDVQVQASQQNPGHAHYAWRGLKSPAAGGPQPPNHDVGDKLKAKHYLHPTVPPAVAAPAGQLDDPEFNIILNKVHVSVASGDARGFLVWLHRGSTWEGPIKIRGNKGIKFAATGGNPKVQYIHAIAFDRHGRQSAGKTFKIP